MKHIHIINTFVWREILILRRSAALLLRSGAKLLLKLSLDIITKSRRPRVNKDGGVISKQFLTLNVCHENTSGLNPFKTSADFLVWEVKKEGSVFLIIVLNCEITALVNHGQRLL